MEIVTETERLLGTYDRLITTLQNLSKVDENSFYSYLYRFILDRKEHGDTDTVATLVWMCDKHTHGGDLTEIIVWLSNAQHVMFPKDTQVSPID